MEFREYGVDSSFDFRDLNRWKANLLELTTKVEQFKSVMIDREPIQSRVYAQSMRMYASHWNEPFRFAKKLYEYFPYLRLRLRRDYRAFDLLMADDFNQFERVLQTMAEHIEQNQQYYYVGEVFAGEL